MLSTMIQFQFRNQSTKPDDILMATRAYKLDCRLFVTLILQAQARCRRGYHAKANDGAYREKFNCDGCTSRETNGPDKRSTPFCQ
jgi:hypothetical protein